MGQKSQNYRYKNFPPFFKIRWKNFLNPLCSFKLRDGFFSSIIMSQMINIEADIRQKNLVFDSVIFFGGKFEAK